MISLDFFDTLVVRDVFQPSDIFYFVGKYAKKAGLINMNEEEFKLIRLKAEVIARKKSAYEEVTLDEIYNEMANYLNYQKEVLEKIKDIEKNIEKSSIVLIEENAKKVFDSIIISDTYHSKDFINEILDHLNLKGKGLYVSSEYRKTKHHGSLYDEVLGKFSIEKHIGDNQHSDYKKAIEKNINAVLYSKSYPSRYEKMIYYNTNLPYELRAVLSGVMKATRLQTFYENSHLSVIHNVSSNVIAPFLYGYVNWLLKKALDRGIETLYFVARDGQILFEIAKVIKNHLGFEIELKYLYGSRKAWHLPAITEIDEDVLDWLFDPTYFLSIEEICKRAEIEVNELVKVLNIDIPVNKNLDDKERSFLKDKFRRSERIHKLILARATEKRDLVVEYLVQEGFSSAKNIGIVDVGWRGRQQASLSKILNLAGLYPKNGITGFYVGLLNPIKPVFNDSLITFFEKEELLDIFVPGLFESFCAADHGSCIGYTKQGDYIIPLLRESKNTLMINWGLNVQHQSIVRFSEKLTQSLLKYSIKFTHEKEISKALLKAFIKKPTHEEANVYCKIKLFEDQEESVFYNMCELISIKEIFKILFFRNPLNHNVWINGCISLSIKNQLVRDLILKILDLKKILVKRIRNMLK